MAERERTQTLAAAIDCGNWVVVRDLLCDEDVDVADIERCLVLHKLASPSNISLSLVEDIVDKILSRDVNINMADNNGDTAVMAAARCENWKVVWLLMSRKGALPDKDRVITFLRILGRSEHMNKNCGLSANILGCLWDNLKQTIPECHHKDIREVLIHVAAKVNSWWFVRGLLTTDIDFNILDEDGMGIVHRLAMGSRDQHFSLLLMVLDKGADINFKNIDGNTVAHIAVKNRKYKMVEALLRRGAKADIVNNENYTVLHSLCYFWSKENTDIFLLLQKNSLNIEARDSRGNTALQVAVKERNYEVAEKLLILGARADVLDENGKTVLHLMATDDRHTGTTSLSSFLKRAIEYGAELKTKDHDGNTAVQVAAKLSNWKYVDDLTDQGAVLSESDSDGYTVYDRIISNKAVFFYRENMPLDVQLHLAVIYPICNEIIELVKKGANVNKPDCLGYTVLQKLVQLQSEKQISDVFSFMLRRGANINVVSPDGDNLLHLAAKHKNWLIVEQLLKRCSNIYKLDSQGFCVLDRLAQYRELDNPTQFRLLRSNFALTSAQTPKGETLLQLAAKHGNIRLVEYLVQQDVLANINQLDSDGLGVIHRIIRCEFLEAIISVVNLLLTKGADPNLCSSVGDTALHLAARHNHWDIVERLVEHGCDLNKPDSEGFYVLHRLAQITLLRQKLFKGNLKSLLVKLLTKGANVSVHNSAGDSVIQLAAKHNNWSIVELLVEHVRDINELDSEGFNILHRLAQTTQLLHMSSFSRITSENLFCMFLNKGADVSLRCFAGDTPLHMAAKQKNWDIAYQCVEQGCDVNQPDNEGFYLLHRLAQDFWRYSSEESMDQFFRILLDKGACLYVRNPSGDTVLHVAAKHSKWSIVKHLVEHGANINEPDSEGFHILHRLAQDPDDDLLKLLVGKGIDLNCKCPNIGTALHIAAKEKKWNFAKQLVEFGADINEPDFNGLSVLHIIAAHKIDNGRDDCIALCNLMLIKGADMTARSPLGELVFHLAARHNNWEIIEQILTQRGDGIEHIDDIDAKDSCGNTALHLCVKARKWDQVYNLLMYGADANLTDDGGHTVLYRLAAAFSEVDEDVYRLLVLDVMRTKVVFSTERDEFGDTLIQVAARNKNVEVVDMLLDHLDDVNVRDIEGQTILHRVVQCKSPLCLKIVQKLLKREADTEIPGPNGDTVLHLALIAKEWEIIRSFLERGADVDRNFQIKGKSIFHALAADTSVFVDDETATSITRHLLTRGFDLNERDTKGDTPLNLAATCSNWRIVRVFLENGADPHAPDSEGWYVSHRLAMASKDNSLSGVSLSSILQLLANNGFQVNQKGPDGKSCVQLSIERSKWELFWWLVEFGVDYCISLNEKEAIFKCISLLKSKHTDQNKLKTLMSRLTESGDFSCQELTECVQRALKKSVTNCNWAVVKALVECDADVGINVDVQSLMDLLFSNYRQKDHEVWLSFLDTLLARGADINCRDNYGRTILFQNWSGLMAKCDNPNVFDSLLHALVNRGTNLILVDSKGNSLLRYVLDDLKIQALKSVKFLIKLGMSTHQPDLTAFNIENQSESLQALARSPTHRAFERKYVRAFEMLVKSGASSDNELFYLNTRYQVELCFKRKATGAETHMLDILNHAASQPRSLKSLCRLTVSRALGFGPRRMERVKSLPLPTALQDYLLFCDIFCSEITRPVRRNKRR